MRYIYSCHTDTGCVREVNQDSLVIKSRNQTGDPVWMAAVCDGVGGLSQGETASRRAAEMISDWFDYELPQIQGVGMDEVLVNRLKQLISDINMEIYYQAAKYGFVTGTTLSMLLLRDYHYFIGHVGDSRVYEIGAQVRQLTPDHTWVAREVELGHMSPEQAMHDSRQNIVLRCIGAEACVNPWIGKGRVRRNTSYLLCTDGFWHHIKMDELLGCLRPNRRLTASVLEQNLHQLTEQVKNRGETDNITSIAVNVY